MKQLISDEDRPLIWICMSGVMLFFIILSLAGCTSYIQNDAWTPAESTGPFNEHKECRLLYTKDWQRDWLECRYCSNGGERVDCPR